MKSNVPFHALTHKMNQGDAQLLTFKRSIFKTFSALHMPKTLLIISGPTAVGKTDIAIRAAQHFGTSIISADSRQCYREMNIGTAKPTPAEMQGVPHFFINSHSVLNPVSAAGFEAYALAVLENIFQEKDIAILCGGTGLYIKALCEGLDEMPPVSNAIAQQTEHDFETRGIAWLQESLEKEDTAFYEAGEMQNPARMLRALTFTRSTGKSIIDFKTGIPKERSFSIIKTGLQLPRNILYQRINERVDKMMENGLLEEVESLQPLQHLKPLNTVGYSELFAFLNKETSLENAIEKIKQHTRNYAKRQMTWFRKDDDVIWLDAADDKLLEHIISIVEKEIPPPNE